LTDARRTSVYREVVLRKLLKIVSVANDIMQLKGKGRCVKDSDHHGGWWAGNDEGKKEEKAIALTIYYVSRSFADPKKELQH
jgi:hypothetical protein